MWVSLKATPQWTINGSSVMFQVDGGEERWPKT